MNNRYLGDTVAISDRLKAIFGWTGRGAPADRPRRGSKQTQSDLQFGVNPYQAYASTVKPPYERRRKYDIYDEMDEMPLVSSILDAYAEDSTQVDRDKKAAVWVETGNAKARNIINAMFERVKIEEFVEAIHRDVAKYGDDFAQLDIQDEKIMGLDWRDPRDIERIENTQGILIGFEETNRLKELVAKMEKNEPITYTHKPWELVHFRLYRRKREWKQKYRNIYGTSLLAGSERIAKQVKIMDDMLMVHRLTKSLDTRVYKVDTGRASVEEEVQILKRWQNSLKRKPYLDPASGRFDSPFDPFTFQEDLFWPAGKENDSTIDVISGQPNVSDLLDVEMFNDKFFGSLRAPKGYFGFEGDIEAKATLSSQDMKWGRSCNSLQRAVINGLTRLCQIELALNGLDAINIKFSIRMVVPSVLEELSRLEAMQTLIDAAERMANLGETFQLDSDAWRNHVLKSTMGFTDYEIKQFTQDGPGDDPDTEPDMEPDPDAEPDAEPDDDEPERERLIDAIFERVITRRIAMAEKSEIAKQEELPPKDKEKRGDAFTFHEGKIVKIAFVDDSDAESQQPS